MTDVSGVSTVSFFLRVPLFLALRSEPDMAPFAADVALAAAVVASMTMVSKAKNGGAISTRTFIPHRCHSSIGVLGAVSVATACLLAEGPAAELSDAGEGTERSLAIEHPTGEMTVVATLGPDGEVVRTAILRTARKLFDGTVFG